MKAAVLTGIREIEIIEVPEPPAPDPCDVLLKVEMVGVCGSDVHYYAEGRIGTQHVTYPYRIGHEFSGTVLKKGAEVENLNPGDRVAVDPAIACGSCDQCRAGRENTCRNILFLGCPGELHGCLTEKIVMPAGCCFPIPENLSLAEGALVEPLSVGLYAVDHLSGIKPGLSSAILGCGPIGLSTLLALDAVPERGQIYAADLIDERLGAALEHGAAWGGNPDKVDIVTALLQREPDGLDLVFDCCGKQEALDQAVEILKPGGKLVIIGIPEIPRISFAMDRIRKKELCIQNVRRQNNYVQPAIDFIAGGKDAGFMVTHTFSLEDSVQAFELVDEYRDGVIKAMIKV